MSYFTARTTAPLFLSLFVSMVLSGCGAAIDSEPQGWDEAPLSSYQDVFSNTPDNDSLPYDTKADGTYPEKHTALVGFQSPVKSQGRRGVCSIFSTVGYMEHLYLVAGHPAMDFFRAVSSVVGEISGGGISEFLRFKRCGQPSRHQQIWYS